MRTQEGWIYLSVVLDLFSSRVIGWALDALMTTDLAIRAPRQAINRHKSASCVPPPRRSRQSVLLR
ncbi:hypothetical protein [Acetobacter conturbans]|uniref:hypothetical protein n=1 Tax=Acetobacter conturbans TaxID=1737472 RepID=UPI0038D05169